MTVPRKVAGAWAHGLPQPEWVIKAACRAADVDRDDFHPENRKAPKAAIARAKAVCAPCPVRAECREFGNVVSPRWGIWGGFTAAERQAQLEHGRAA